MDVKKPAKAGLVSNAGLFPHCLENSEMEKRYPNLDILRLLLALEVVIAHVWNELDSNFDWNPWVMAVPAFLGISGFLVLKSFSESGSWKDFAKKRFLRIVPALLVSFALSYALVGPQFAMNSMITWLTGGLVTLEKASNLPLWSLLWEEIAYATLAILWLCGAYKRVAWIWALFFASTAFVIFSTRYTAYVHTVALLPAAFFCGNLMYLYRRQLTRVNAWLPWVALIIVLVSKPMIRDYLPLPPAMFQAFFIVWAGIAGKPLITFRFPDLSYGAYIYHFPVMIYVIYFLGYSSPLAGSLVIAALLASICIVSWYAIEKPALKLKPPKRPRPAGQQQVA